MRHVNLIVVFDCTKQHVLMCLRRKNPYQGLYNFVGGKRLAQEDNLGGAYRELAEETGISRADIDITPFFFTQYFTQGIELQVYTGVLKHDVELVNELNPLRWVPLDAPFGDETQFAGHGNIQHMVRMICQSMGM